MVFLMKSRAGAAVLRPYKSLRMAQVCYLSEPEYGGAGFNTGGAP